MFDEYFKPPPSVVRDDTLGDVPSLFQSNNDVYKFLTPSWKEKCNNDLGKENHSSFVGLMVTTTIVEKSIASAKMINENKGDNIFETQDQMDQSEFKKHMKRKDLSKLISPDDGMITSKHNMVKMGKPFKSSKDWIGSAVSRRNEVTCDLEFDTQCDVLKGKLGHLDVKSLFGHSKFLKYGVSFGYVRSDM
ncbi:hypothetical protein Tco_1076972 [Tanacetum coccineum]